jgi:hypothetical protein
MSRSSWRDIATPIIRRVVEENGTADMAKLRRALREAYPWGKKRMHPYRIWRDEVKRQLNPAEPQRIIQRPAYLKTPNPDQLTLLE